MNRRRRSFDAITTLFLNVILLSWVVIAVVIVLATGNHAALRVAGIAVLVALWLLGSQSFADLLLRPLERRYPRPSIEELRDRGIEQVVVLSGGAEVDRRGRRLRSGPPVDSLTGWSMARFLAGQDLAARLDPGCRIIFTGAAGAALADASRDLFPERASLGEFDSKETAHHPRAIAEELGGRPFVLVTSAFHLPRSMRVFRRGGLDPIAYPCGYLNSASHKVTGLIPSTRGLELSQLAIAEYAANVFDAIVRP